MSRLNARKPPATDLVARGMLLDLASNAFIAAIVAPRRAGTTTLMLRAADALIRSGTAHLNDFPFMVIEDYRLQEFAPQDADRLLTAFHPLSGRRSRLLFFDEIRINRCQGNQHMKHLLLVILMSVALSPLPAAVAGENCTQLGGACQNACRRGERAEAGAFEDCGEAQECCTAQGAFQDSIRCCIASFQPRHFGALNCGLPQNNQCAEGSGSPVACEDLRFCKELN